MKLVFISHRHSDQHIASLLVDFLLAALKLENNEILCTSVPGHTLSFGKSISELLKDNLNTAAVLIALITTDSLQSSWVLFELGSSWAMGKLLIPILGPGITHDKLPGPLKTYPVVQIEEENASFLLREAINQIASNLEVLHQNPNARTDAKLKEFVDEFKVWKPQLEGKESVSPAELQSVKQSYQDQIEDLENNYQSQIQQLTEQLKQLQEQLQKQQSTEVELKSEKGVDYTYLRDLLAAGKWKEADEETTGVMLQAAGNKSYLEVEDIDKFPCDDLRTINKLWLHYSDGKFGFSIQKEIYESLGGTREYNEEVWKNFGDRVRWRKNSRWVNYSDLIFDKIAPPRAPPRPGFRI